MVDGECDVGAKIGNLQLLEKIQHGDSSSYKEGTEQTEWVA